MKKVLISIISVIAIIAILIVGKIQMDKYRVKSIVHGEDGKAAIENMLKIMDEKALTPEGKIKSYKIDENYTHNNPMGGLIVRVIINDDPEELKIRKERKEVRKEKRNIEIIYIKEKY